MAGAVTPDLFGYQPATPARATRFLRDYGYYPEVEKAERKEIADSMRSISGQEFDDGRLEYDQARKINLEADRYEACGCRYIRMECEADNLPFQIRTTCKSRICPECAKKFYYSLQKSLLKQIQEQWANKKRGHIFCLVTMTVTSTRWGDRMPSRADIQQIYRESSDFLRMFFGKYRGKRTRTGKIREDRKHYRGCGAVSVIEVGGDNNNAHVHSLVYGPILSRGKIAAMCNEWKRITGDSWNVQVDAVQNPKHATYYIYKYITKPPQTDSYNRLAAYSVMIKGSRRIRTTGIFYNQIKRDRLPRLKIRCPYCDGPLRFSGIQDWDPDDPENARRQDLYPLLQTRDARAGPLPLPAWSGRWIS